MISFDLLGVLSHAVSLGASDLHCSAGEQPVIRVAGELVRLEPFAVIDGETLRQEIVGLVDSAVSFERSACKQLDCALELAGVGRFRVNIFIHSRGLGVAFRVIPESVPDLSSLGLPTPVGSCAEFTRGLVLVTGATGSGKSTTLAALVKKMNEEQGVHIVTIEDPIEFTHVSKRGLIHQREVGSHTESFAHALRAALREDPDVILIGELRDYETIHLALTAAETGHLVLASLHSARAHTTIDRVIDVFPAAQQAQARSMLAGSLQAVVTQELYPRIGGGRVVVAEILLGTPAVRNLIREAKTHQLPGVMQVSRSAGMQSMEAHLDELRREGVVAVNEAL